MEIRLGFSEYLQSVAQAECTFLSVYFACIRMLEVVAEIVAILLSFMKFHSASSISKSDGLKQFFTILQIPNVIFDSLCDITP